MTAAVPSKRTEPQAADIMIGAPVRAQTWRELGMMLHWLRGYGLVLIPAHRPGLVIEGSALKLYYRVKPQGLAIARVWVVGTRQPESAGGTIAARLKVTLPSGLVAYVSPPVNTGVFEASVVLYEPLSAKSSARENVEVTFERNSGDVASVVESLACYELPRAVLTLDATDLGVDYETLRPAAALIDSTNRSIGAVAENLTDAISMPRRHLHEQSFGPVESDPGAAANPTAWVDLLTLPVHVLPRKIAVGDTTYVALWDTCCFVSAAGTTFEVRITTGISATTDVLTVDGSAGGTSLAWLGPSQITLTCEDPTKVHGVPTAGFETVQYAVRRTAGTGKITLRSVAAWEE